MTQFTSSNQSNLLKQLYPEGPEYAFQPESAFFDLVTKKADWEGDTVRVNPIIAPNNGSHSFTDALEDQNTPSDYVFSVTDKNAYVIGSIESKLIKRASSKRGAIVEVLKNSAKTSMEAWAVMMRRDIWRNHGGARGQISSGSSVGSATITLADTKDIVHFHVGMRVQASSADGTSGSVRAGYVTITARNPNTGTLTISGNWNAATNIPTVATSDYLFRKGDFGLAFNGILSWIPASDPGGGDSFFGVDRSVDPMLLGGVRRSAMAGKDIATIILDAASFGRQHGAKVKMCFLNDLRWAEMAVQLQSQGRYRPSEAKGTTGAGFEAFEVIGVGGPIKVVPDAYCPYAYGLLTDLSAWEFRSIGDFPHWEKFANDQYFVEASADAKQFRLKGYGNLICHRPVDNILVTF